MSQVTPLLSSDLPGLPVFGRGKVRDTYDLGDRLLMVTTDRISAFDVVLPNAIPYKGAVLTQLSAFWFGQTGHIVPNHMITAGLSEFPPELQRFGDQLDARSMLVKKAKRIDVECVVRGYMAGSAWAEYCKNGTVCGDLLPACLAESAMLPSPIFTPSTKEESGHDQNISQAELANRIGKELADRLAEVSIAIYTFADELARGRGIIIADTKFEFGFIDDELTLIDEALTPDSSRFWDLDTYRVGQSQPSFDKQYVRDWLVDAGWNKEPPAPVLPDEVVAGTSEKYLEAYRRITGRSLV